MTPIIVFVAAGTIGTALAPRLLKEHPLLLLVLEARNRNLLLTANLVSVVPYTLVGVVRRMASDPCFFLLGHFYGDRAVHWIQARLGAGTFLGNLNTANFRRFSGLAVFLFPGAIVCVLAGASRMRVRTFLILNLLGTLTAVLVLRAFAGFLRGPIEALQRFNGRNFKWLTIVSIVSVALWLLWQRFQGTGEIGALSDLSHELDHELEDEEES